MKTAEEYFEANEPHDPNCIISGQRVSKRRCIQLMEEYAKQNTLDRDKVMEILRSKLYHLFESDSYVYSELADAIMSLSLPTLSEEEIEIAAAKLGQAEQPKNKELRRWLSRGFRKGAKWAIKELTKPKDE
jgi:hypothetical protein